MAEYEATLTAVEALNKILEDGIMAQAGDAEEIIAALEYYGFKIIKVTQHKAPLMNRSRSLKET